MHQLIVNILFSTSVMLIVAISFSIIFSTARFFHFAHAAIITIAAYTSFFSSEWLGAPLAISVILALIVGAGLGWCLDLVVYRPMRHVGATPLILLLASLGLYIVIQNTVAALFGDDTKILGGSGITPTFPIFGAKLTSIQLIAIGSAMLVLLSKILIIDRTRVGLSLRAVADSPDLARISGIEVDRTMGIAFCLGSFLVSAAGIFRALDVGMTPTMGLPMLLLGVVAVVLGRQGKTLGIAVASLFLASCQQLASWELGTHWEEATAFLVLLTFLLIHTQGISGQKSRRASVWEIQSMPKIAIGINLPFLTITGVDYRQIVNLVRHWLERRTDPLRHICPLKLARALAYSVEYLLADRLDMGVGKGGWGLSDKEYMRCLYGAEMAEQVHESVMTTVVVVQALHDCLLRIGNAGIRVNGHPPKNLLDSIINELDVYLQPRWHAGKGYGGVLVRGHEGDLSLTPRYRHTAWLFHLWNLLPGYRDRVKLTAINLLDEFDSVKWRDEKIATAVAVHSALSLFEGNPLCESLGTVKPLKCVLEGKIESKFSREISGWTSGNTFAGGRQLYTLFVCAEMACMHSRPEETLTKQINTALMATMREPWRSMDGRGVSLKQGGENNISASSLMASALMRKPNLSKEEKEVLASTVDYLVESLVSSRAAMHETFSWAVSYFVRDISRYLAVEE